MGAQTEQEVKRMNQKGGINTLKDACRRNTLNRVLENYIKSCREYGNSDSDGSETSRSRAKKSSGRFPNIAGFCRFYKIGIDEFEELSREYPNEIANIYAILEDEALNSTLPPAILSAYMKKRLGYDRDTPSADLSGGQLSIRFEHDIFSDGE